MHNSLGRYLVITLAKDGGEARRVSADISLRPTVAIWNAPNYCTRVERDTPMVAQAAPWFRSTGVRVFREALGAASASAAIIRKW